MTRPAEQTFPPYFGRYIQLVKESNILEAFEAQQEDIDSFFQAVPEDKTDYAYAPGKWTMKVLLQHILDAERIFNYRALCIARKETQSLPDFEENDYAMNSHANHRHWNELVNELQELRKSTVMLYKSFSPDALSHHGLANDQPITPLALGFITVGHLYHHMHVVKERYLC